MGEILCVGATHYPGFVYQNAGMAGVFRRTLASPLTPPERKDPKNWPGLMRQEYGLDGENVEASAAEHRRRAIGAYRKIREEIDAFNPDFIVIWADDQYGIFKEDCVPPFCVFICDEFVNRPYLNPPGGPRGTNIWEEPEDTVITFKGHPEGGRYLARALLENDISIPYAYKLRHNEDERGLHGGFIHTVMYLDYDRTGFPYPVVPVHVNCYGQDLVRSRGGPMLGRGLDQEPDPPAPSPRLCFDMGATTARVLKESPWRVVLMGSSSWSHAFLTKKHDYMYPDVEADQARFEELRDGKQHLWRGLSLTDIENNGQHELLNWVPLAGAITELGYKTEVLDFVTTNIFNSSKCAIVAKPPDAAAKSVPEMAAQSKNR